ncbi:MAG TPA: hypothetical protein VHY34_02115 [Caulobacteraceae bacterium]|nr:hypothetical protein [Caulobacteraceae bacterium]
MALAIETFSSLSGGNSFFKAVTHPEVAQAAMGLVERLSRAKAVAVYDPLGFLEGFAACHDLGSVTIDQVYVQDVGQIGCRRLGREVLPVTELHASRADAVLIAAFDSEKLTQQVEHLAPCRAELISLDSMRLGSERLTNRRTYLDPLNFVTNFAFFRDADGAHTRLMTANYWSGYGASETTIFFVLFDGSGAPIARWRQPAPSDAAPIVVDSREVRARFDLPPFEGQLFMHVAGAAGHDVVKYALDTFETDGASLSCTHDANAWPADLYAGLPAPRDGEQVVLWLQNSLPVEIPAGAVALGLMGDNRLVAYPEPIAPFASVPLDVAQLLPEARWPQQIELTAGRYMVRPRYEVVRSGRRRIAHVNVERTDLKPNPDIRRLEPLMGKGYILPAPILPPDRWRTFVLPTPMATTQAVLPIAVTAYDAAGEAVARRPLGALARRDSAEVDLDALLGKARPAFGHVELTYDWDAGDEADGWLHALFRYEDRESGHAAETSFGAHIFNTALTYRDEPQSYSGRPPGLSTRLFLRLGEAPLDTLCHLIYPASTPWRPKSSTDLILNDAAGREVTRKPVEISCGGSLFWRYSEMFDAEARQRAEGGYVIVRDVTCRLFGYHGLAGEAGRFSLDHMFGF